MPWLPSFSCSAPAGTMVAARSVAQNAKAAAGRRRCLVMPNATWAMDSPPMLVSRLAGAGSVGGLQTEGDVLFANAGEGAVGHHRSQRGVHPLQQRVVTLADQPASAPIGRRQRRVAAPVVGP